MNHRAEFGEQVATLGRIVDEVRTHLTILELEHHLSDLEHALRRVSFRVAVLGRFKAGKSSIINVLLGSEASPVATLPCTSTAIEFIHGDVTRYEKAVDGGGWQECYQSAFEAVTRIKTPVNGSRPPTLRVTLPAKWLGETLVLVDTPGTDEDEGRLEIAERELGRADAALVVLRADQVCGLAEMELAEEMQNRIGLVMLVVNRFDVVEPRERDEILANVRSHASAAGIPADRVLPLSATAAALGEQWALAMVKDLRTALSGVLTRNIAGAKLLGLQRRTEQILEVTQQPIMALKTKAEQALAEAEAEVASTLTALIDVKKKLKGVQKTFDRTSIDAGREGADAFIAGWEPMLERVYVSRGEWTSTRDPLFSPKQLANEIGEQAKNALRVEVEKMCKSKLSPVISRAIDSARTITKANFEHIFTSTKRFDAMEEKIVNSSVTTAFGKDLDKIGTDSVVTAAVTATVSIIVGYIVADIVLFYVLGLITGFLNPFLLAAGVLVGGATYVFAGKTVVQSMVRKRIAGKIRDELSKPEIRSKISTAITTVTREQISSFGGAYVDALGQEVRRANDRNKVAHEKADHEAMKLRMIVASIDSARASLRDLEKALRLEIDGLEAIQTREAQ